MSDYDDEMQEIVDSVKNTRRILTETLAEIDGILEYADDNASNDAFYALTQMLRKLRVDNNMCIATMCEEAQEEQ